MRLTSDIESGNGKNIQKLSDDSFAVETVGQGSSYSGYFLVKVENDEDQARSCRLEIQLDRGTEYGPEDRKNFFRHRPPFWTSPDFLWWEKFAKYQTKDLAYEMTFDLGPKQNLFVTPMVPLFYSEMMRDLEGKYRLALDSRAGSLHLTWSRRIDYPSSILFSSLHGMHIPTVPL